MQQQQQQPSTPSPQKKRHSAALDPSPPRLKGKLSRSARAKSERKKYICFMLIHEDSAQTSVATVRRRATWFPAEFDRIFGAKPLQTLEYEHLGARTQPLTDAIKLLWSLVPVTESRSNDTYSRLSAMPLPARAKALGAISPADAWWSIPLFDGEVHGPTHITDGDVSIVRVITVE
jgi:hypothetical protein